ncbi:MAG: pyridoxamine 5'-phosphate oxidase family protein [Chloroflexi bacterium]|nr:pyridoxamine 5'-phosphate oxidase family protein [Chloroflexota bacterium]MCC6896344.1 pyridoxamine 5'-phosphate oxidase family protein [Anaerolineae bacterium]
MVLSEPVRAFLQKPVIVRMAVVDPNGYPHVVPVWYGLDGDDVIVFGYRNTRKVDFIKANPKGSIQIGGDPAGEGYLLKGEFSLEDDTDNRWARQITYAYEATKENADKLLAEWILAGLIVMRLKVDKVSKV